MSCTRALRALVMISLTALAVGAAPAPSAVAVSTASVSGVLIDHTGSPVSGAAVNYERFGTRGAGVVSAADGSFTLPVPADQSIQLVVMYLPRTGDPILGLYTNAVTVSGALDVGVAQLPAPHPYRVRVVDSVGTPVEGAQLGSGGYSAGGSGVPLNEVLDIQQTWIGISLRTGRDGYLSFLGAPGVTGADVQYVDPVDGLRHRAWWSPEELDAEGVSTVRFDGLIAPVRPAAPLQVSALAGDRSIDVQWQAPQTDGGAPVKRYEVTATAEDAPPVSGVTADGAARHLTLSGLVNGRRYIVSVVAVNGVGAGDQASPAGAESVVPAGVPTRVHQPNAHVRQRVVKVRWKAAGANGSEITAYRVTSRGGHRKVLSSADARSWTFAKVKPGRHKFQVAAKNRVGWSAASVPVTVRVR